MCCPPGRIVHSTGGRCCGQAFIQRPPNVFIASPSVRLGSCTAKACGPALPQTRHCAAALHRRAPQSLECLWFTPQSTRRSTYYQGHVVEWTTKRRAEAWRNLKRQVRRNRESMMPFGTSFFGALERATRERINPHLRPVRLKLGAMVCEAGGFLEHACFPESCVLSFLTILENESEMETANIGREGAFSLYTAMSTRVAIRPVTPRRGVPALAGDRVDPADRTASIRHQAVDQGRFPNARLADGDASRPSSALRGRRESVRAAAAWWSAWGCQAAGRTRGACAARPGRTW